MITNLESRSNLLLDQTTFKIIFLDCSTFDIQNLKEKNIQMGYRVDIIKQIHTRFLTNMVWSEDVPGYVMGTRQRILVNKQLYSSIR